MGDNVKPRSGGAKDTAAVVAARVINIPANATGCVFHSDAPARVRVTSATGAETLNDANFGYIPAGFQVPWTFTQGRDKTIQWSPETAVATVVRVFFF